MKVSTYFIIGLLRGGQLFQERWFFVLYLYVRLYFLLTLQLNYFKMTSCWTDVNHWALSSDKSDEKCYPYKAQIKPRAGPPYPKGAFLAFFYDKAKSRVIGRRKATGPN
jgi:hypothetical protein